MIGADLLITNIGELATLSKGAIPRIGPAMAEVDRHHDAAVAVARGTVAFVGSARTARREVKLRRGGKTIDAQGGLAVPGFVDAHTHLLFAGDRHGEIEEKIRGKNYLEIAKGGGGLFSTVRATRSASRATLLREGAARIRRMASHGSLSIEVKSGYALTHAGEIELLKLVPELARRTGIELVPTFLGAHAVPPEYEGRADAYIDLLVAKTVPEVARRRLARFCDVFCEPGFFTVPQAKRLLQAALARGLGVKVHAEEFLWSGGARLAAQLGARSAEHLLEATVDDRDRLSKAGVTAVLLPMTPFASLSDHPSQGRAMVDAGVPVALGSDLSPNAWTESMTVVLSHAVYSARLTPAEALTAATVNAAHASDVALTAGQIAVGRPADLLLFDVPTVEHLPYRMALDPTRILRQGKFDFSA